MIGVVFILKKYISRSYAKSKSLLLGLVLLALLLPLANATAASMTAVSQGYKSASTVVLGTIVSADSNDSQSVVVASIDNKNNLFGVAVDPKDSLLNLSSSLSRVQVATGGVVLANVNTINGDISVGDKVTISPISGIGMKASEPGKILGVAQSNFNSSSANAQKKAISDKSGKSNEIYFGQIPVVVGVSYWTPENNNTTSGVVDVIANFVSSIVGKKVSPLKAILGVTVLLIAMLISAIILYSSVSSSIRSIGRNPLSGSIIKRSLFQVILIVIIMMMFALGGVYLIVGR